MGVSRTAGNNWARGYKTYRGGEVVGFVPAVERLAVRQISSRFLPQDERIEIADLRVQGLSVREIGRRLGRAPTVRVATLTGTRPVETDQFSGVVHKRPGMCPIRSGLAATRGCAHASGPAPPGMPNSSRRAPRHEPVRLHQR